MFLVGDGHTNMILHNTLEESVSSDKFDYIITNPPYGQGTIKADSENILSKRTEIAFFFKNYQITNMVKVVLFYLMVCWKIQVYKITRTAMLKESIIGSII